MNKNHVYDMIIVGGGPGGYTAALYGARAGLYIFARSPVKYQESTWLFTFKKIKILLF